MAVEQRTVGELVVSNGAVGNDQVMIVVNANTANANNRRISITNFFGNISVNVGGTFNLVTTGNGTFNQLTANVLAVNTINGNNLSTNNYLTFAGNTGDGILVDTDTPTYPWADLLGEVHLDETGGSNRPSFTTFKGNIKSYQFGLNDQVYNYFHIPHDYAPNTNVYIHVHWATNAASSAGAPTFSLEASYAKGHGQMQFSNNITVTVSNNWSNSYTHMISETQLSGISNSSLLNTSDIETDGIIAVRTALTTNTMNVDPFVLYVDIHYQSTGIGTKNKAPTFTV